MLRFKVSNEIGLYSRDKNLDRAVAMQIPVEIQVGLYSQDNQVQTR
jgi:hypothetical protein